MLPLPAGGAVTGADVVVVDCRYGPSESIVSVMKISKTIKEKKKHTGDSRRMYVFFFLLLFY